MANIDISKKYNEDLEINSSSPKYNKNNDRFLGERGNGFYQKIVKKGNKSFFQIIFDNAHGYLLDYETGEPLEYEELSYEIFFHKILEGVTVNFLKEKNITKYITPNTSAEINEVNINYKRVDDDSYGIFVRYIIDTENRILHLTNIMLPIECKHKGFGIFYLSIIYKMCKSFSYRLFLRDCVSSFYNRMVSRGAKIIIEDNDLEITDNTDLTVHKH